MSASAWAALNAGNCPAMQAASTSAIACSVPQWPATTNPTPFSFGKQGNVVRRLAGDKAVRAAVDGLLQIAAARTADLGQTGDRLCAVHVLYAGVQRLRAEAGQCLDRGGHRGADAAAALGKALPPLGGNAQNVAQGIVHALGRGIQILCAYR